MKAKLYETQSIVKKILTVSEAARNSDMALYAAVVQLVAPHAANKPFCEVLTNLGSNRASLRLRRCVERGRSFSTTIPILDLTAIFKFLKTKTKGHTKSMR